MLNKAAAEVRAADEAVAEPFMEDLWRIGKADQTLTEQRT
jgi:hypothetical protein